MRSLLFALLAMPCAGCSCGSPHLRDDAGSDAPAIDGGTDAPTPDAPPFDAGPICSLAAPTSDVAGDTPLGPIAFDFAWAGLGNTSKACFGVALHMTDADALSGAPTRQLWLWLPIPEVEPIVGTHTGVTVQLELDGAPASTTTGVVEITSYTRDDVAPAVEATIDVGGDGFDVHGTIAVPYCDVFRDPCI